MIKLRGFGGKSEFRDHKLTSFTLMASFAAATSRIKLFATVPTLDVPPAIAPRLCSTIDSISNGLFGLNVITGWQRQEYLHMGLWRVMTISITATNTLPSTIRSCAHRIPL
jgi:pyrimidine oxygenase